MPEQKRQKSRPIEDIEECGWDPDTIYSEINEAVPDDSSFVEAVRDLAMFEVALDPLEWPDDGLQTLTVRLKGGDPVSVLLLQGDEIVWEDGITGTGLFQNYVLEVDPSAITDYTDLRVVVIKDGVCSECCPDTGIPKTLTATITDTGDCGCGEQTVTMKWQGGGVWGADITFCGSVGSVSWECDEPDLQLGSVGLVIGDSDPQANCHWSKWFPDLKSCEPLSAVGFFDQIPSECCGREPGGPDGHVRVDITE